MPHAPLPDDFEPLPLLDFIPAISPKWTSPVHLAPLAALFERARHGESLEAFATTPPRHGKTELIKHAIVQRLLDDPTTRIAFGSYSAKYAQKRSREIRKLYQRAGGTVDKAAAAAGDWRTGHEEGGVWASGVDGSWTGEGFDCLVGETMVMTAKGATRLDAVAGSPLPVMVLSYDHEKQRTEWRPVVASRFVERTDLVEVTTQSGRRFRCTPEHRVFVAGRGYRPAASLRGGDPLVAGGVLGLPTGEGREGSAVCQLLRGDPGVRGGALHEADVHVRPMRAPIPKGVVRGREAESARSRIALLHDTLPQPSCDRGHAGRHTLSALQEVVSERPPVLRPPLPGGGPRRAALHQAVRLLPTALRRAELEASVLRSPMRERCALGADARVGQLALQDGDELRQAVRRDARSRAAPRRPIVRDVLRARVLRLAREDDAARAPHRRSGHQQRPKQPHRAVQSMPHATPQVGSDTVALVRRIRGPKERVYDIEVEGTRNFFAGEILVHNCIILDDPVKGRREAESPLERDKLWTWFQDDLHTRKEPGGSVIVVHTRWHVDDLGGRLLATGEYEHVQLPAIDPHGRALWPERFDEAALAKIRKKKGEYTWASLYMGSPFAKGGRVFGLPTYYDLLPGGLRYGIGVDLAYSKKTHADWSVIVVLGIDDVKELVYVVDVIRLQVTSPVFATRLKSVQETYKNVDARWYYAGPELGIADFISTLGVELDAQAAATDKFIRAQPVAAAWEAGRVLLPKSADWLADFLLELGAFTGVDDLTDDQVDALAAAYDSSEQPGWVSAMQKWRRENGGA